MGFVHPDKPDIFLSYAHVNNVPPAAFPDRQGWVTTLVRGLEDDLAMKLGRVDSYDLWRDSHLAGHVELTPEILGRLRDSAVLLLVLSPAYLASEWCRRELAAFHEEIRRREAARGRVFVVEFDRVDPNKKPPELADLRGYRFWVEHPDTRKVKTLGYPFVREKDEEYFNRLDDLCIELVRALGALRQHELEARVRGDGPRPSDHDATEQHEEHRNSIRALLILCLERLCQGRGGELVLRRVAETLGIKDFPVDQDRGISLVADFLVDPAHNQTIPLLYSLIVSLWGNRRSYGPADILDECWCLIVPLHFCRDAIEHAARQLKSSAVAVIQETVTTEMGAEVLCAALDRRKTEFQQNDPKYRGKNSVSLDLPALGSRKIEDDAWAFIEAVVVQGDFSLDRHPPQSDSPIDDAQKRKRKRLLADLEALDWREISTKRVYYCVARKPGDSAHRDHALRVYQEVRKLCPKLRIVVLDEDALARGDEAKILTILKWRHAETRNPHAR